MAIATTISVARELIVKRKAVSVNTMPLGRFGLQWLEKRIALEAGL